MSNFLQSSLNDLLMNMLKIDKKLDNAIVYSEISAFWGSKLQSEIIVITE